MKRRDSLPDRLSRSTAIRVGWWLLISITIVHALVFGSFPLWFTMGGGPDRGDYLMSAGAFGAASLVLFAAAVAVKGLRGPPSALWTAITTGAVLCVFAAMSYIQALFAPASWIELDYFERGVEFILSMPWSLALLVAGIPGAYYLWRGRRPFGDDYGQ